jgi:hypothetical protein
MAGFRRKSPRTPNRPDRSQVNFGRSKSTKIMGGGLA